MSVPCVRPENILRKYKDNQSPLQISKFYFLCYHLTSGIMETYASPYHFDHNSLYSAKQEGSAEYNV